MASPFLCFTLLFLTLCTADGYEHYTSTRCLFNSTELKDMELIRSYYYNKLEYVRFSSSVGKFVGYTEFGVKNAEYWNNDYGQLAQMRAEKKRSCQYYCRLWYTNVLTKSVKPSVRLHSTTPPGGHHPAMLVCSVYNFYPKQIKVSWLRDGQEVTSDITSTEEYANADWLYQVHSKLEYLPRSGQKISCVVEHASLKEPLIIDWVPPMPETERLVIVGAVGMILGLIIFLAGVIYTRKSGDPSSSHRFSEKHAESWNKDPAALSLWRPQKEMVHKSGSELCYTNVLSKSVMPSVRLQAMTPPGGHHLPLLLCSVYDFYHKQVKKKGQEVATDVTNSGGTAGADGLCQALVDHLASR
ncbi:rano class II histocompatibility antigen, A beta chain-like [Archocentrus centrarchus]|uniref:rano class II histocompatibility antigen, A beta chain-like n=1 Tax=Archocentrus centrarchus TaxID=63155 RepID=UPI0011EA42BA|nr:rano class II histocompatibility antigen, A beta chain-like [Archocentrus centrarchus]